MTAEITNKILRIVYTIGVVAFLVGVLDPLEGSVVILAGSALITLSTYLSHDRHHKVFLLGFALIVLGVFFLFYFSSLGGFGGDSSLSWWCGLLILFYPAGWILTVVKLIARFMDKASSSHPEENPA